jgi:lipopolysaccharide assembly protein A
MQFLRILFWVVLAVSVTIFASNNWTPVPVALWGGQIADINLPLLMAVMFLIGFLPPYLILRGKLWQVKRRLQNAERALAAETSPPPEPAAVAVPDHAAAAP